MTTTTTLPRHPRTGLYALGMTRRGPIWPVLGGDETGSGGDGQGGQAGAGQQQGTGGDDGQGQQGQGQQNDGGQQGQQGGQEPPVGPDGQPLDPARLQRLVENLREENRQLKQRGGAGGQQGTGNQQGQGQASGQQQNQQGQAGQAPATDDATAAKLRDQAAQLAVFKHAGRHHGDPVMLTDSMSFMSQLRDLDPDAPDYDTKVTDLLKKHLDKNPHHRTGQAPRGGSDGTGRPGATQQPKGLGGALRAHYAKK